MNLPEMHGTSQAQSDEEVRPRAIAATSRKAHRRPAVATVAEAVAWLFAADRLEVIPGI